MPRLLLGCLCLLLACFLLPLDCYCLPRLLLLVLLYLLYLLALLAVVLRLCALVWPESYGYTISTVACRYAPLVNDAWAGHHEP